MGKRSMFLSFLLCLVLAGTVLPAPARADAGPKPSVQIDFVHMTDQECWGTLLSKTDTTGPASAWDGQRGYEHYDYLPYSEQVGQSIWEAFIEYEDADGFYFLQEQWPVSDTKDLNWTYYPPQTFKLLLYYPATDTYIVSPIYERYAFDSYFTVDMMPPEGGLTLVESYKSGWEIFSLVCRVVVTVAVEVGLAWLVGYRLKRYLTVLVGVNLITQILLNLALNIVNYALGYYMFIAVYVLAEFAVVLIELAVYRPLFQTLDGDQPVKKGKLTAYTIGANIASFVVGMVISVYVPGIF